FVSCATLIVSQTTSRFIHALIKRICGLHGPRSHQKTDSRRVYRDQVRTSRDGKGPRRDARGVYPRRPDQRRGPRHPRSLFRRNAKDRRQLPGNVPQGEERTGAQIQGGAVRINRDKANKVAHVVADALADMKEVDFVEDRNTIRLEVRKVMEDLL